MTRCLRCRPGPAAPVLAALALLALPAVPGAAQTLTVEEYDPPSSLVVEETPVTRARFPFVDIHSHMRPGMTPAQVAEMLVEMEAMNMAALVNLSGGSGADLAARVAMFAGPAPGRFFTFANVDFSGIDEPGWTERAVAQLERDVRQGGARGLKIFKNLGLDAQDSRGVRIPTDDPRIDPVWAKAGELGIPVLIHTGEPAPFFDPHDADNERWLELKLFPDRARPAARYPSWETVMAEQWNLFRKHPETTFINAHLGWMGNDLGSLEALLDTYPNVYTEFAAVIAELGRQPRRARQFFIDYQDRILFGKDTYSPEEYHLYFRVLETADEYIKYFRRRHAFWRLYGLDLPDEVLRKVYYENALKVLPGLDPALFPGG